MSIRNINSINEAYVVEVKSHLREEAITQLNTLMGTDRALFPEHNDKKLYGIIAAVDMSEMLKKRVLEAGFYVARIQDETLCWIRLMSFKRSVFEILRRFSINHAEELNGYF